MKSAFAAGPLSDDGIGAIVEQLEAWEGGPTVGERPFQGGGVDFEPLGGAINEVAPDETAFVHRDSPFLVQFVSRWDSSQVTDPTADVQWLRDIDQAVRPHLSGSSYQNYVDPELDDHLNSYHGANLPRLREVKSRYDPDNFLRFPQSIPPL